MCYYQYYHTVSEIAQGNSEGHTELTFLLILLQGTSQQITPSLRRVPGLLSFLHRPSLTGPAPAPRGSWIPALEAQPLSNAVPWNCTLGLTITKPRPNFGKRTVLERIPCEVLGDVLNPSGFHLFIKCYVYWAPFRDRDSDFMVPSGPPS